MWLRIWLCMLLLGCLGADAGKQKGKNKNSARSTKRPHVIDSALPEDGEDDDAKKEPSIRDFFPYIMGRKTKFLRLQPLSTMYYKPGYASFYRKFYADFAILVHPPMDCLAVYICFLHQLNATKSGLTRIDIESACENSIRIMTMEQILYHVQAGKAKPYVILKPELDFRQKKGNPDVYEFQVWTDFDHEDVNDAKQITVEVSTKDRDILLLTSSPYCNVILFNDNGAVPGSIMQIESNTDASQFYRIMGRTQYFPQILSRTAQDSRYKTYKSEVVININKADTSQWECCPKLNEFTGYLNDDEWQEISVKPIANQYRLAKAPDKSCSRTKFDDFSPLQAIFIEVHEECEWMKICFDKGTKWCESEGSALSLYFVHDVFIPTDSDEAVMFALPMERLTVMRINFMMNEPAIEFSYGLAYNFYEATHVMHMQAYADVNFDPSKFNLHVIKAKGCQARFYNAEFDEALFYPKVPNCLKVDYCQCFSYTADRT